MVRPRCREQEGFGLCAPSIIGTAEEEFTDLLRAVAATRFSSDKYVQATRPQRLGERLHLRRLADPLPAFQADEPAPRRHAIPNSDFRPTQMRPKKPALPTSSPATSGTTCGGVSPVVTTSCATSCPFAIGATSGPSYRIFIWTLP